MRAFLQVSSAKAAAEQANLYASRATVVTLGKTQDGPPRHDGDLQQRQPVPASHGGQIDQNPGSVPSSLEGSNSRKSQAPRALAGLWFISVDSLQPKGGGFIAHVIKTIMQVAEGVVEYGPVSHPRAQGAVGRRGG